MRKFLDIILGEYVELIQNTELIPAFIYLKDYLSLAQKLPGSTKVAMRWCAWPPGAWKNWLPTQSKGQRGKPESFICSTLSGQATLPLAFDAKPFGLIQTLLFAQVNEINRLCTMAK